MTRLNGFSLLRWWTMVLKEFAQLKRDRLTFGMIVGIPIAQLLLFGYAINTDPKQMPAAIISADNSEITRTIISTLKISGYFNIVGVLPNEEAASKELEQGNVLFVINIPAGFTRQLLRGERPAILIQADATDPMATSLALSSAAQLTQQVSLKDLTGSLASLAGTAPPFNVHVHRLYNPEGSTQYNIIPGLMGVILTMTMALMTGLAITRERERATMENLLAMPVKPIEVMTGKIVPYIAIGLIQITIILLAARMIFGVPFLGMPRWAQYIGNVLPLTHFNRLIRGIMLKGNTGLADGW